jgi:hypothetical protein
MIVGDIVRLKPDHHLSKFIKGNCYITQVVKYRNKNRKTRYHIKSPEDHMTWVHLEELDLISDLRNQVLDQLLVKRI